MDSKTQNSSLTFFSNQHLFQFYKYPQEVCHLSCQQRILTEALIQAFQDRKIGRNPVTKRAEILFVCFSFNEDDRAENLTGLHILERGAARKCKYCVQ